MPHTSRRALATMLHDVGVPIAHNADHLGHADTAMTASVYPGRDFMGGRSSVAAVPVTDLSHAGTSSVAELRFGESDGRAIYAGQRRACAPGRTRTCDLEIRRLLLYPAEL